MSIRYVAMSDTHEPTAAFDALVGRWEGTGVGEYPTIDPFAYAETLEISRHPKGFLVHHQRTQAADDGRPLHAEIGYWRQPAPGRIELVLAHPTGVTEVCEGGVEDGIVHVRSSVVGCTDSAKPVESLERWYDIEGDVLGYRLSMGAVGVAHQHHLARASCAGSADPMPRGRTNRILTSRVQSNGSSRGPDEVAVEEPLEIRLDGNLVGTTMRTPGHDFELAAGFCSTEGLLGGADVRTVKYCRDDGPAAWSSPSSTWSR